MIYEYKLLLRFITLARAELMGSKQFDFLRPNLNLAKMYKQLCSKFESFKFKLIDLDIFMCPNCNGERSFFK